MRTTCPPGRFSFFAFALQTGTVTSQLMEGIDESKSHLLPIKVSKAGASPLNIHMSFIEFEPVWKNQTSRLAKIKILKI